MAVKEDDMQFDVRGDIFQINGKRVWDSDNWRPGTLRFDIANGAGKWIDLLVESIYPTGALIWQTGHIGNGSSVSHDEELNLHRNKAIHITRWAPGVFGIPGNGGGEVFFVVPDNGDVTINISVTG
jgi:hypothetical protein